MFKCHVEAWGNPVLFRLFHRDNERKRFGKRLHCSPYAKKRMFPTVHYVWVTGTLV